MKLSTSKSRIVGVQLGELHLNVVWPNAPPMVATFGLLGEDGSVRGRFDVRDGWSKATQEALQGLLDALEDDALHRMFVVAPMDAEDPTDAISDEPRQF